MGVITIYYVVYLIIERDTVEIFDSQLILLLFYILFLFLNFIVEVIKIFKTKSIFSLTTTAIGLLSISSLYLTNYIIDLRDSSPIVISSKNIDGVFLDLREDKTFKFTEGNWASIKYSRGNFYIKDSLIYLNTNKLGNYKVSRKWVIRKTKKSNSTFLLQKNKDGTILNDNLNLEVISDNRK